MPSPGWAFLQHNTLLSSSQGYSMDTCQLTQYLSASRTNTPRCTVHWIYCQNFWIVRTFRTGCLHSLLSLNCRCYIQMRHHNYHHFCSDFLFYRWFLHHMGRLNHVEPYGPVLIQFSRLLMRHQWCRQLHKSLYLSYKTRSYAFKGPHKGFFTASDPFKNCVVRPYKHMPTSGYNV